MNSPLEPNVKVVIVGRPNVGKSSLFNRLLGKRLAIVDSRSGITRDRVYGKVSQHGKTFDLVDTGGFFQGASDDLESALLSQVDLGLQEADIILLVMDVTMEVHPMDREILKRLRGLQKPIFPVINKVDTAHQELASYEFSRLGLENFYCISALHGRGIAPLLKALLKNVPESQTRPDPFRVAILGKPNVGKSSLVNALAKTNRSIVNPTPGTTRDSLDIDLIHQDQPLTLVDTAGLTRRSKFKAPVDAFSVMRAKNSLSEADMAILLIDAERHIEKQDMRIARLINEAGRCCFIGVNKWDLLKGVRQEHYKKDIYEKMPWLGFAPICFLSVLQGKNISKILDYILDLKQRAFKQIPTSILNQLFTEAMERVPPPAIAGKKLKVYYVTQTNVSPATFVLFINSQRSVSETYVSYLRNTLRQRLGMDGMPIRFQFREKIRKS